MSENVQIIFILISLVGGIYFLFRKSPIDYYTLAYVSSVIYFIPGFFGVVSYQLPLGWQTSAIVTPTYIVMSLVELSILIFAVLVDMSGFNVAGPRQLQITNRSRLFLNVITALTIIGFVMLWVTSASTLLAPDKNIAMESLNRWDILFYISAEIGTPLSFILKKYRYFIFYIVILLVDVYLGFRSHFAVALMATVVLGAYYRKLSLRNLLRAKYMIPILIGGFILFAYKPLTFAVKAERWNIVLQNITDIQFYQYMFTQSEPFVVQNTLNEVLISNFHTSAQNIYDAIFQIIPFAPRLGFDPVTFNSLMQPALFPTVSYGLASNIWAQMWSVGGWLGLMSFVIIFNIIIFLGNRTLRHRDIIIPIGLAPLFCYWVFYSHRSGFQYIINLEKRVILVFIITSFIVYLLYKIGVKTK